ncbi:alpha/beta fold hydrolase [Flavobacterium turcicum]|uniref:Alpha/beta fold hydrolase n=1 Tax=Flavobacterium turcicum TaxID=2764718 RepID=A0ABR7JGU2_9FLAO|nr:alpha/beta fold hydrolase [Flavobacterium turcicum]MBC5863717.1 alpha/beta fold hydrolase [Flavobacterium turcicum]NHL02335.1 alpha/beta fold hydrolase [Flavobacterium turcicum]
MKNLEKIDLFNFDLEIGKQKAYLPLYYQVFGQPLGTAPVVVVNHSLTGNSTVTGENGWWSGVVGEHKPVDTDCFTIIAFNIPGNGFEDVSVNRLDNYRDYSIRDIARIFWEGLFFLKVDHVFAVIGGSLGGAIAWEMAVLQGDKIDNLIPIATDWKATDWVIANVLIQDQILNNSDDPIVDARLHATLLYRTPEYVNKRFQRNKLDDTSIMQIENWLLNHGFKLKERYRLASYKLMNYLLKTNDITRNRKDFLTVTGEIQANIHLVTVDTDYFFVAEETRKTYRELINKKQNVFYHQIQSIHGHDAYLVEFNQLSDILKPIFNYQTEKKYVNA